MFIPDPKPTTKREGEKNKLVVFCSINITKFKIISVFELVQKKICGK
jgi:hypothetical protein